MKKFLFVLLAILQTGGVALAAEAADSPIDPIASVFEAAETEGVVAPQPVQFFLGALPTENVLSGEGGSLDAELLYQMLVDRAATDFDTAANFIRWTSLLVVFAALFFTGVGVFQYLFFKTKAEAELREFKRLAQNKLNEFKKSGAAREHDLQRIVDQQQRVLEELKEQLGLVKKVSAEKLEDLELPPEEERLV